MSKGQVRSNRETKKPKKEKPKVAASAPSRRLRLRQIDETELSPHNLRRSEPGRLVSDLPGA
jgi:hypothetical protein